VRKLIVSNLVTLDGYYEERIEISTFYLTISTKTMPVTRTSISIENGGASRRVVLLSRLDDKEPFFGIIRLA
jgi:hypothetical protein